MKKNLSGWAKTREFINQMHLWVGLGIGLIVILVCLSGTIYVFNDEIREAATPELFKVKAEGNQKALSAEQLIALVQKESGGKVVSVRVPGDADRSWQFGVKKKKSKEEKAMSAKHDQGSGAGHGEKKKEGKDKKDKKEGKAVVYYVNPYTGQILGNSKDLKSATVQFMTTMFSLHRWLLLDKIEKPIFGELENRTLGGYITGASAILFTFGVLSGVALWFPRKWKSWKQGLKIKTGGSWKRTNHDLHNSLGFYACIFLFCMSATGPQWSFDWYRTGLRKTLGTYKPEEKGEDKKGPFSEIPAQKGPKLLIADYVAASDKVLNYKGDCQISLAADSAGTVNVSKFKAGFFDAPSADRLVLDQYSARVIQATVFAQLPFNERVSGSIKAIHTGGVYGLLTKILYFMACLIATSLPVTGTLIWINKMKKKKTKPAKALKLEKLQPAAVI